MRPVFLLLWVATGQYAHPSLEERARRTLLTGMHPQENRSMVRHFIVKGRVQGVGFRWFVQREAYELGLRGWVRNTADGDVEVLAAGSEEQIRKLHAILARGSRGSRVDGIEQRQRPEAEAESLQAFEIEGAW